MTEQEAVAFAIQANAIHGLTLNRKDRRRSFNLYHEAGLHLKPDGNVKSLHQIRRDLGNIAWPNTISRWLREANIEPEPDDEGPNVSWSGTDRDQENTDETEIMDTLTTRLSGLVETYQALEDPWNRQAIRERLKALLRELEASEGPDAVPLNPLDI